MSGQDEKVPSLARRVREALRMERSDPHLKEARRHLHPDLREVPGRVSRYLETDVRTRAIVVALLVRQIENHQPGARAGGLAIISNGLATAATIVVTITSVVVAGAFGLLAASTDPATGAIAGVTTESISAFVRPVLWVVLAAAVAVAIVGWIVWNFQRTADQMRATSLAWLSLYESAANLPVTPSRGRRRPRRRTESG